MKSKEINEDMGKAERGGFFDLPKVEKCNHPEHEPPRHLHIPQGKGYKHVCPSCGKVSIITPQQISF